MRHLLCSSVLCLACLVWVNIGVAVAQPASSATVEWTACPPMPASLSAARMSCGWLDSGDTLQGQRVRLRFAILRARPEQRDPHPVVYVPGGPGESAGLDAQALMRWQRWQQQAGWPHDVVLFDPRGTGQSWPRVRCRAQIAAPLRPSSAPPPDGSLEREARRARQCLERLGQGVLQALGPAAQLRDIAALLDGLDVEKATLWGLSYGTRIAQLFAQRYASRVDRLVLDSLVPFDKNELAALPIQIDGAIKRLERMCSTLGDCATPAPRRAVAALLARFDRQPAVVALVPYRGVPPLFEITPYRLLLMILFAAYDSGQEQDTIARLERALHGYTAALVPLAVRVAAQGGSRSRSEAVFWATRCALYDVRGNDPKAWRETLADLPLVAPYVEQAPRASVCADWPLPRFDRRARSLDRPMLVLAGSADVLTPPGWGQGFVAAYPSARWVQIEGAGHAPTLSNRDAQRAVAKFLRQPGRAQSGR